MIICTRYERIIAGILYLRSDAAYQRSVWLFQGRIQKAYFHVVFVHSSAGTFRHIYPASEWDRPHLDFGTISVWQLFYGTIFGQEVATHSAVKKASGVKGCYRIKFSRAT